MKRILTGALLLCAAALALWLYMGSDYQIELWDGFSL